MYTVKLKGNKRIMAIAIGLCTNREKMLCYYDFERGHMLRGTVEKKLKNGIIFKTAAFDKPLLFEPLTQEEFNRELQQTIPDEILQRLNSLDDICIWYRKQAGMV